MAHSEPWRLELNEATWWSKWVETKWVDPESFLLHSRDFPEYFFNRAGFLRCDAASASLSLIEGEFASSGRPAVFFVQDACGELLASMAERGYSEFERMSVMRFDADPAPAGAAVALEKVGPGGAEAWADAFLESFGYGNEAREPALGVVGRLVRDPAVTLVLAREGGDPAGTVALFRTDGLMGAYCVGTRPRHRRAGVASAMVAEAGRISAAEGRTLILQTLSSDGVEKFYLARGFVREYVKLGVRRERLHAGHAGASDGLDPGVSINRGARGYVPFNSVFLGFDRVGAVRDTFGGRAERVLSELMVDVKEDRGYMHIDDERGCVMVNKSYLEEGGERSIYLDVVHELVHIRQHQEGRQLFDRSFKYVDRPTELEAYHVTVREARRLKMSDAEIAEYLKVEWVTEEDFKRFLVALGVSPQG